MDFSWLSNLGEGANKWLADPNNQQLMANTGSAVSSGEGFGTALGNAVGQNIENVRSQAALAKLLGPKPENASKDPLMEMLMKAFNQGNLLSPTTDGKGFDSLSITGDGKLSLGYDSSKNKANAYGSDPMMESMTSGPLAAPVNKFLGSAATPSAPAANGPDLRPFL